jgi:toxin ParE1/3/4
MRLQLERHRSLSKVLVRVRARRDLIESAAYLDEMGGPELAARFTNAVYETFEALALMPRMGAPCGFRRPSLSRLRRWPVKDFENWLIFYQPNRNGLEIVHVLHGSRDIETLLS